MCMSDAIVNKIELNASSRHLQPMAPILLLAYVCYFLCHFYSTPLCKRCTSHGNSVCLSVCPFVRLSVCPSITRRYCVKTTARSTVQFALSDSKNVSSFAETKKYSPGTTPSLEIFARTDLPPSDSSEP